ncbi:MAG: transketolase family protein [Alphaproteobacteria bacterium]
MRNTFADTFYELGKTDPRLAIVVADISPAGSIAKFREEFPDRFVNTGVSEQIMIGMVAGMALRGMRPFAYTIATFTIYRPFEFVRDDLGYQELPVTVVGIGGGVTYSTLGSTHHAMEDVAVASAIPTLSVIAPCDPAEVRLATRWCALDNQKGPVYLRLGKAGEPVLTDKAVDPFVIGKIRYIKRGKDTCILSYGTTVKMAMELAARLEAEKGESVSVVSCHTVKPLDADGVAQALRSHKRVIVMEEHVPHGGLGSRVKEIAWDIQAPCQLKAFSLQEKFIHCYGDHADLLKAHGLSVEQIYARL